jgi:hypothetical protein
VASSSLKLRMRLQTFNTGRSSVILNEVKDLARSSALNPETVDYARRTARGPSTPLADSLRSG